MSSNQIQKAAMEQGAPDAGQYFRVMAEFVGFTPEDSEAIKESRFIIEKYIPEFVARFYDHLLRYPPTRKYFLKKDGSIDQEYLQLRMHHLTNFWRRLASGVYDDKFARYVDYVGLAHTSHGADPKIYIPERYVIGQVGYIQHAISEALYNELHEIDPKLHKRAQKAWNMLMMVILELLARAYSEEHEGEALHGDNAVDSAAVWQLAIQTYENNTGLFRSIEYRDVAVAREEEIPDGERKIVQVDDLTIGVFHHRGQWVALRNSCLHRGGPVATGALEGDTLTCPWHGYQYNLPDGRLLMDASACLESFPVEVRDGQVFLRIPTRVMDNPPVEVTVATEVPAQVSSAPALQPNELLVENLPVGSIGLTQVDGDEVAVYNLNGEFYALQNECTHSNAPMNEGELDGELAICPLHGSCFDVKTGAVRCGPAKQPLKTYRVVVQEGVLRVMPYA